jgi:hypothetical protein
VEESGSGRDRTVGRVRRGGVGGVAGRTGWSLARVRARGVSPASPLPVGLAWPGWGRWGRWGRSPGGLMSRLAGLGGGVQ